MELIKIIDSVDNGLTYNARFLSEKYKQEEFNHFFTFELKHYSVVNRMIYLNNRIKNLWKEWKDCLNMPKIDNSNKETLIISTLKHQIWQNNLINIYFSKEEFFAGLRKVIDECLVLYCIAAKKIKKNGNPLESIGEYLNESDRFKDFDNFIDFFKLINDISNSYKHSIINSQFIGIEKDEPIFHVFVTKNDKTGQSNYLVNSTWTTLDDIVKQFNEFYSHFDNIIKC